MRGLVVGISPSRDNSLPGIPFAAKDAARLADALPSPIQLLTDNDATSVAVRSAVASIAKLAANAPRITGDLPIFLVFIVRAESGQDGVRIQLADGPVDLNGLLDSLWQDANVPVVLAVDFFRDGVTPPESAELIKKLLQQYPTTSHRALLCSDEGHHGSHISGDLQSGVWSYHLATALSGEDPNALTFEGSLTIESLRRYLESAIPSALSRAFRDGRLQAPVTRCGNDNFVLGMPSDIPESSPRVPLPTSMELRGHRTLAVKDLAGFQKSVHTAPGDTLDSSQAWIRQLATPNLKVSQDQTLASLRSALGYTRRQIRTTEANQGTASVATPDFSILWSAHQCPDRPQFARLSIIVSDITDPAVLGKPGFSEVFPDGFQELFQPFQQPVNVTHVIDTLEERRPASMEAIDYPTDLSRCDLTLQAISGHVRIEPDGVTIHSNAPLSTTELARRYALVKSILKQTA